jgi:8-hydroxy-5-deazaflavin:NADPH oxidoreductase
VARLSVEAGYDVVLSNSRGPETLRDLVADIGPRAQAATVRDAAASGELVVVTIPFKAHKTVPVEPLAGKVVLDTGNYYPARDGQMASLDDRSETSSGLVQQHLSRARVAKVLNNITMANLLSLARPVASQDRSALPTAGDDAGAKTAAAQFLDSIGYGSVDAAGLADSWRREPGTPVFGDAVRRVRKPRGHARGEAVIRAALEHATH